MRGLFISALLSTLLSSASAKKCYTATITVSPNPSCLASLSCGPVPECIRLDTTTVTIPPRTPSCSKTKTRTKTAKCACQVGCAVTTKTVTVSAVKATKILDNLPVSTDTCTDDDASQTIGPVGPVIFSAPVFTEPVDTIFIDTIILPTTTLTPSPVESFFTVDPITAEPASSFSASSSGPLYGESVFLGSAVLATPSNPSSTSYVTFESSGSTEFTAPSLSIFSTFFLDSAIVATGPAISAPTTLRTCALSSSCFTATTTVTDPACPAFDTQAAGGCIVPDCVVETLTTVPGVVAACVVTPTVTEFSTCQTACPSGCQTYTLVSIGS